LFFGHSVAHAVLIIALVAGLGIAVGRLHWRGIGLGISGVLFAGLVSARLHLTVSEHVLEFLKDFGLILFVYSIGMQVGPGFASSFRNHGVRLNLAAATIVAMGTGITYLLYKVLHVPMPLAVGLLAGGTTNTPSLAAAQQVLGDMAQKIDPAASPGVGYAVAYPFGVVGIILTMLLIRILTRVSVKKEAERFDSAAVRAANVNLKVTRPLALGKTVAEIEAVAPVTITRLMRKGTVALATPATVLEEGDIVHVVGQQSDLVRVRATVGELAEVDLRKVPSRLSSKWVFVTSRQAIGHTLEGLGAPRGLQITRLLRAGVELSNVDGTRLQFGDMVMAVGDDEALSALGKVLCDTGFSAESPQILAVFVGIVLGVLVGSVPLPIPGFPVPVKLGLAGGPLLVAMILSRVGRAGPLIWHLPPAAKVILRDLGIVLFLACVGLKSGEGFFHALAGGSGWSWMGLGALITAVPLILVGFVMRLVFKVNYVALCGLLAGSMTDPPALAFASSQVGSESPAVAYASVYPLVMVMRVVFAQLLVVTAIG
jgi:putative transport protein